MASNTPQKKSSPLFKVIVLNGNIVCQKFFLSMLQISLTRLRLAIAKVKACNISDRRGTTGCKMPEPEPIAEDISLIKNGRELIKTEWKKFS